MNVDFLLLSASVPCEREQDLLKWYNLSSATVVRASTRHKTLRISMMPVYVPRPELMARVEGAPRYPSASLIRAAHL